MEQARDIYQHINTTCTENSFVAQFVNYFICSASSHDQDESSKLACIMLHNKKLNNCPRFTLAEYDQGDDDDNTYSIMFPKETSK